MSRIALVVSDKHEVHHVHDRGYGEQPARIPRVLAGIEPLGIFDPIAPREFPETHIREVHGGAYIDYFKKVCDEFPADKQLLPYIIPVRNPGKPPEDLSVCAGYYCIDTFTPLNRNAFVAASRAVDCALTAAQTVLDGSRLAYALVRPPGHHAERNYFGGFCYFNSTAIAANRLSRNGKVAVIDIDYHHGNGTQDIFYERGDVLTVSLHGHPSFAYPYFSGFEEETGSGEGTGRNINYPLKETMTGKEYYAVLQKAARQIRDFAPRFLVIALGFDTGKGDPTGTFSLTPRDFERNGKLLGSLGLPTAVIQEGGYRLATLPANASAFFRGLSAGADSPRLL